MPPFTPTPYRQPARWYTVPGAAGPGIRGGNAQAGAPVAPRPPMPPPVDPVTQQYQAELALLEQIQALYQQQQAQQVAQQRAAYQALAQQLQPIAGQVEDIVNRQTGAQTGFAKGFSDATAQLANQSTNAAQGELASFGMPSGNLSPVGTEQGNALYGEFGFIPATGFSNYGAAQAAAAAMLLGTARLQGEQQIARQMSQFQSENLLPLQIERLKLTASLPQRRSEYQAQQAELKDRKRGETLDLYKAGLLTQRDFARRMGVKNWRKFPNVIPGTGSDKELTFREVGGSLFAIDPATGRAKLVIQGPSPSPDVRTVGGYLMERDPRTGKWVRVAGTGPAPQTPHYQLKTFKDGSTAIFDPGSGALIPLTGAKKTTKPASLGQKKRAGQLAKDAALGALVPEVVDGAATGEKILQGNSYTEALDQMLAEGIPRVTALRALRRYWRQGAKGIVISTHSVYGVPVPFAHHEWEPWQEGRALLTPAQIQKLRDKALVGPPSPKAEPAASGRSNTAYSGQSGTVVEAALTQIGKPYVFGSGPSTQSFDCSDLIQWAYKQIGVDIPRVTWDQIKVGRPVKWGQFQPGDLVFTNKGGHVMLYIGNGKLISAPYTGSTVKVVDVSGYRSSFVTARRVLPDATV